MIFVAELGDKSQLIAFTFGTRYPMRWVAAGLLTVNLIVQGVFAFAGGAIGAVIEGPTVGLVGAALFMVFAVAALRDTDDDDIAVRDPGASSGLRVAATVAGALFLAEIGDKTMFATVALAASEGVLPVWAGSFLGMSSAGLLGAVAGRILGDRIPERALQIASAVMFGLVGVWLAWDALVEL